MRVGVDFHAVNTVQPNHRTEVMSLSIYVSSVCLENCVVVRIISENVRNLHQTVSENVLKLKACIKIEIVGKFVLTWKTILWLFVHLLCCFYSDCFIFVVF